MIAAFIFYLHIVGAAFAFSKGYFEHKLSDAFMSLAFVGIIFSVGWTIAGFIVRFFLPEKGFGPPLDSDTISLIIVVFLEVLLYGGYFINRHRQPNIVREHGLDE
ncbi:MAG: hypothetical protein KFF77_11820 [Bacteroidetes bacterium]|nr:hypothetical protein [Bacteroidota bacterium]